MNPYWTLLIMGVILGIVYYLIGIAPFLTSGWKRGLQWGIIVVALIVAIKFLLALDAPEFPKFP